MSTPARNQLILVLAAAVLGLLFAGISTHDYVAHLDRQLHDVHCSIIPGLGATGEGASGCRVAMNSAYSALFRGAFWGGIPIALFALGLYVFFSAFAVGLLAAREEADRRLYDLLAAASFGPLAATIVMALISAVKLGSFCKTCIGLYVASILLCLGAVWAALRVRRAAAGGPAHLVAPGGDPLRRGGAGPILGWVGLGALCLIVPVVCYVAALPDYRPRLTSCGTLPAAKDGTARSLLKLQTPRATRPATVFVDPLCPTCKALHQRLDDEGVIENLDLSVALFPLDSSCNWMVDRSLHPGACLLSRAVVCAEGREREALDWVYRNQDELTRLGKAGDAPLRARVREHFGGGVDACLDAKKTKVRMNNLLQYAVANRVPVSTPQLYLGERRVCDEDTDLGLRYTLSQLAPEVLR
ncbi:MAG TPA: vitamin K epoxide reductase family protein [Polyangia bacterium]|jgi:uncharacterized membrane protein